MSMADSSAARTAPAEPDPPSQGKVLLVSSSPDLRLIITSPDAACAPRLPSLERLQWEYIHAVLGSCGGNVSEAARQLGLHRQSLQRMLRRHPPSR